MNSAIRNAVTVFAVLICVSIPSLAEESQKCREPNAAEKGKFPIGRTHEPLGTLLTLQGVLVDGPSKGDEDGTCLEIQKVNGRATQEANTIPVEVVRASVARWDENPRLPPLELGKTYEFDGFETGQYRGIPDGLLQKPGMPLQSPFFHFRPEFQVYQGRRIAPIRFMPAQFVDRRAIFEGTTANKEANAVVMQNDWIIIVRNGEGWPTWMEGKLAAVLGVVRKTGEANVFGVECGEAYLIRLEDQIGHEVQLRGYPREENGQWAFWYRGQPVYVDEFSALPSWSKNCSGRDMALGGILEKRRTPQDGERKTGGRHDRYYVRNAKLHPTGALLPIERARTKEADGKSVMNDSDCLSPSPVSHRH